MKNVKSMPNHLIAFENYLHIVAMLYYKRNFNIHELLIIPETSKEIMLSKQGAKEGIVIKSHAKPGRKKAKNAN